MRYTRAGGLRRHRSASGSRPAPCVLDSPVANMGRSVYIYLYGGSHENHDADRGAKSALEGGGGNGAEARPGRGSRQTREEGHDFDVCRSLRGYRRDAGGCGGRGGLRQTAPRRKRDQGGEKACPGAMLGRDLGCRSRVCLAATRSRSHRRHIGHSRLSRTRSFVARSPESSMGWPVHPRYKGRRFWSRSRGCGVCVRCAIVSVSFTGSTDALGWCPFC